MTYTEKLRLLVNALDEKSQLGTLKWREAKFINEDGIEEDDGKNEVYETALDDRKIEIRRIKKPDGGRDFAVDLYGVKGEYVKTIWDSDLKSANYSGYNVMRRIFQAAEDNAAGAMEAVDEYLKSLGLST